MIHTDFQWRLLPRPAFELGGPIPAWLRVSTLSKVVAHAITLTRRPFLRYAGAFFIRGLPCAK